MTIEGYILVYNTDDIITASNKLFGRVVRVKRGGRIHYYYYPGLLDSIEFFKLSNGCYFIRNLINNNDSLFNIYSGELSIDEGELITAREYFRQKYNTVKVRNIE